MKILGVFLVLVGMCGIANAHDREVVVNRSRSRVVNRDRSFSDNVQRVRVVNDYDYNYGHSYYVNRDVELVKVRAVKQYNEVKQYEKVVDECGRELLIQKNRVYYTAPRVIIREEVRYGY